MTAMRPVARSPHRLRLLAGALVGALLSADAQAQNGFTFIPSTFGGTASSADGVSADGTVVVGWGHNAGAIARAFRWTSGGGMVNLGSLLGGNGDSRAVGVSADGNVVAGFAHTGSGFHAFRWVSNVMTDLGTLGGSTSFGLGVSADGAVVVGFARLPVGNADHAFRWTSGGGMVSLGTLGGTSSVAGGVSADGAVVVGWARLPGDFAINAYRWTSGGMVSLGTFGGTNSEARGVSANGAVVVGWANTTGNDTRAFRWTSGGGMASLGTLGGTNSEARGVSADGAVVVGTTDTTTAVRAFRWTQATGMQSVENWLRAAGVTVVSDITQVANATNADGSVVVGTLAVGTAFIARVAAAPVVPPPLLPPVVPPVVLPVVPPPGSGLITLPDLHRSLAATAAGGSMVLSSGNLLINGAHGRPLMRRVAAGQRTFWLAGDWGRDGHGSRSGDTGVAEAGFGYNFGPVQVNVSLGQIWAGQALVQNGSAKTNGTYMLAEVLIPLSDKLWATLGGYGHGGDAKLRRGYLNAGSQDYSSGKPGVNGWGLRARLDWDNAIALAGAGLTPYVDLGYSEAKLAGYTESGGGFPARFNARTEKSTEMRVGVNASRPLFGDTRLLGTLEAVHRFEKAGARTSGQMIGLFGFDLDGRANNRNWLRAGVGVEGKIGNGTASLMLNVTTRGEKANAWLAANWQMAF